MNGWDISTNRHVEIDRILSMIPESLSCILDSKTHDSGSTRKIFPASGLHKQNLPNSGIWSPLHGVNKSWANFEVVNEAGWYAFVLGVLLL